MTAITEITTESWLQRVQNDLAILSKQGSFETTISLTHDWEGKPLDEPLHALLIITPSSVDVWSSADRQSGVAVEVGPPTDPRGPLQCRVYQPRKDEPVSFTLKETV